MISSTIDMPGNPDPFADISYKRFRNSRQDLPPTLALLAHWQEGIMPNSEDAHQENYKSILLLIWILNFTWPVMIHLWAISGVDKETMLRNVNEIKIDECQIAVIC